MAAIHELERTAAQYATKAVNLDRKGDKETAIEMYRKAIETLIKIAKLYPDYSLNKIYMERVAAYRQRIKMLQGSEPNGPKTQVVEEIPQEIILKEKPNVKWSEIIGLEDAKRAIKECIIYPVQRPDLFPLGWPRGILLFGPPGCGKTLLAAAVATQIKAAFFSIDAASIMSRWLGESERNVAKLFNLARGIASEGKPAIIFIDEIDSLAGVHSNEVGGEVRVRNQFLKEMDSIVDKGKKLHVYVIGATNKPWELDWAFIRRFQRRILVPLPNYKSRLQMFKLFTKHFELAKDVNFRKLAKMTEGFSGSDIRDVCQAAQLTVIRELFESGQALKGSKPRLITMQDFVNAIEDRRPSVTPDLMKLYKKWYEKFKAL